MTVTVKDVREYLNNLEASLVPDATVEKQIDVATTLVKREKSSRASSDDIDKAILTTAGYLTYNAYATQMERGEGAIPPPMLPHIERLKELMERFLSYVRRGVPIHYSPIEISSTVFEITKVDNNA